MNVVFLTHRLPYAPNRGDRARAYHTVRLLAPRVKLEVISLVHDEEEAAEVGRVRGLGAQVATFEVPKWANRLRAVSRLAGSRPLTHFLLDAPGIADALAQLVANRRPDVVLAYCSGMARFAMTPPLSTCPLVVDFVDVDSAKWLALSRDREWPMSWIYTREARTLGNFERQAARRARQSIVVNRREADLLTALAPGAAVRIISNGVDLAGLRPTTAPSEGAEIVFCGVMNYPPNVDGVHWFAREIWPLIRAGRPDARLVVVGSDPVDSIRQLAGTDSRITVTGAVQDVRTYLWHAAVSVAPLRTARGLQNKVLEAIAAGVPTVVTSEVQEGLPREVDAACRIGDTPEQFAAHALQLLALSGSERRAVAGQADLSALGWEQQLAPLYDILAAAGAPTP
jgi:sugar transferase (PEP-CTERM/EpsH1 system associated)